MSASTPLIHFVEGALGTFDCDIGSDLLVLELPIRDNNGYLDDLILVDVQPRHFQINPDHGISEYRLSPNSSTSAQCFLSGGYQTLLLGYLRSPLLTPGNHGNNYPILVGNPALIFYLLFHNKN